jgi:hypothetical protein
MEGRCEVVPSHCVSGEVLQTTKREAERVVTAFEDR